MQKVWCVAALGVALVTGCSTEPVVEQPDQFTMTVSVQVAPGRVAGIDGGGCAGTDRLAGLREGAYITVRDAVGTTIGAGNLRRGTLNTDQSCTLTANPVVNAGSDFVAVEIKGFAPITRAAAEAERDGVGIGFGY